MKIGYIVFDTTGGKAVEEAASKSKYYNRCDPRFKWFNPFLCARKNKVQISEVVKKDQTVISPIFNEDFDGLVFTKNSIPLGIDGLIAAEVTGSGVYVPQKIDKELADSFIGKTLGSYQNYPERTEAGGLALEWDINLESEKSELVSDSIAGETYQQMVKGLYVVKEYIKKEEAKLKEIESSLASDEDDDYEDGQDSDGEEDESEKSNKAEKPRKEHEVAKAKVEKSADENDSLDAEEEDSDGEKSDAEESNKDDSK